MSRLPEEIPTANWATSFTALVKNKLFLRPEEYYLFLATHSLDELICKLLTTLETTLGAKSSAIVQGASGCLYFGHPISLADEQFLPAKDTAIYNAFLHEETEIKALFMKKGAPLSLEFFYAMVGSAGDSISICFFDPANKRDEASLKEMLKGSLNLKKKEGILTSSPLPLELKMQGENDTLIADALKAVNRSYAPHSESYAAVAISTRNGQRFHGSYLEHDPMASGEESLRGCKSELERKKSGLKPIAAALIHLLLSGGDCKDIDRIVLIQMSGSKHLNETTEYLEKLGLNIRVECVECVKACTKHRPYFLDLQGPRQKNIADTEMAQVLAILVAQWERDPENLPIKVDSYGQFWLEAGWRSFNLSCLMRHAKSFSLEAEGKDLAFFSTMLAIVNSYSDSKPEPDAKLKISPTVENTKEYGLFLMPNTAKPLEKNKLYIGRNSAGNLTYSVITPSGQTIKNQDTGLPWVEKSLDLTALNAHKNKILAITSEAGHTLIKNHDPLTKRCIFLIEDKTNYDRELAEERRKKGTEPRVILVYPDDDQNLQISWVNDTGSIISCKIATAKPKEDFLKEWSEQIKTQTEPEINPQIFSYQLKIPFQLELPITWADRIAASVFLREHRIKPLLKSANEDIFYEEEEAAAEAAAQHEERKEVALLFIDDCYLTLMWRKNPRVVVNQCIMIKKGFVDQCSDAETKNSESTGVPAPNSGDPVVVTHAKESPASPDAARPELEVGAPGESSIHEMIAQIIMQTRNCPQLDAKYKYIVVFDKIADFNRSLYDAKPENIYLYTDDSYLVIAWIDNKEIFFRYLPNDKSTQVFLKHFTMGSPYVQANFPRQWVRAISRSISQKKKGYEIIVVREEDGISQYSAPSMKETRVLLLANRGAHCLLQLFWTNNNSSVIFVQERVIEQSMDDFIRENKITPGAIFQSQTFSEKIFRIFLGGAIIPLEEVAIQIYSSSKSTILNILTRGDRLEAVGNFLDLRKKNWRKTVAAYLLIAFLAISGFNKIRKGAVVEQSAGFVRRHLKASPSGLIASLFGGRSSKHPGFASFTNLPKNELLNLPAWKKLQDFSIRLEIPRESGFSKIACLSEFPNEEELSSYGLSVFPNGIYYDPKTKQLIVTLTPLDGVVTEFHSYHASLALSKAYNQSHAEPAFFARLVSLVIPVIEFFLQYAENQELKHFFETLRLNPVDIEIIKVMLAFPCENKMSDLVDFMEDHLKLTEKEINYYLAVLKLASSESTVDKKCFTKEQFYFSLVLRLSYALESCSNNQIDFSPYESVVSTACFDSEDFTLSYPLESDSNNQIDFSPDKGVVSTAWGLTQLKEYALKVRLETSSPYDPHLWNLSNTSPTYCLDRLEWVQNCTFARDSKARSFLENYPPYIKLSISLGQWITSAEDVRDYLKLNPSPEESDHIMSILELLDGNVLNLREELSPLLFNSGGLFSSKRFWDLMSNIFLSPAEINKILFRAKKHLFDLFYSQEENPEKNIFREDIFKQKFITGSRRMTFILKALLSDSRATQEGRVSPRFISAVTSNLLNSVEVTSETDCGNTLAGEKVDIILQLLERSTGNDKDTCVRTLDKLLKTSGFFMPKDKYDAAMAAMRNPCVKANPETFTHISQITTP